MKSCEDRIEDNLGSLKRLIGEENVEDIKNQIANLIVERVASDIDSYDCYIFYPPDYESIVEKAYSSTEKKITKLYQDAMLDVAQKSIAKFKEIALKSIENMEETNQD